MRFDLGPLMSVPPEQPFVVPGRAYVLEELVRGDYTLELRRACPECAVHPRCSGFEVQAAAGQGPWGGCAALYVFTLLTDDTLRFTISERDSPSGPSELPSSLCGDYVIVLRSGVPPCLRGEQPVPGMDSSSDQPVQEQPSTRPWFRSAWKAARELNDGGGLRRLCSARSSSVSRSPRYRRHRRRELN